MSDDAERLLTDAHLRNAREQDEHSAERAALIKKIEQLTTANDLLISANTKLRRAAELFSHRVEFLRNALTSIADDLVFDPASYARSKLSEDK